MTQPRNTFVDREHIHGVINGVDYGSNLSCIVRSPKVVLLWSAGSMYFSGRGSQSYGPSALILLPDRNPTHHKGQYRRIGADGGRLTFSRLLENAQELEPVFGRDWLDVLEAVRIRQTLLIKGGGESFSLSRRAMLREQAARDQQRPKA